MSTAAWRKRVLICMDQEGRERSDADYSDDGLHRGRHFEARSNGEAGLENTIIKQPGPTKLYHSNHENGSRKQILRSGRSDRLVIRDSKTSKVRWS